MIRFLLTGCVYNRPSKTSPVLLPSLIPGTGKDYDISSEFGCDIELIRLILKILSNISVYEILVVNVYGEDMSLASYLQMVTISSSQGNQVQLSELIRYDDISLFHYTLLTE